MSNFDRHTLDSLEFPRIIEEISKLCYCDYGRSMTNALAPSVDPLTIESNLAETFEMSEICEFEEAIPLESLDKIELLVDKVKVEGSILDAPQLRKLADFQKTIGALWRYRQEKETKYPRIVAYLKQLSPLPELVERIDRAIDITGEIKDSASDRLRRIRLDKVNARAQIIQRLQKILGVKGHRTDRSDDVITLRDGRYVITIPDSDYNPRESVVHDRSKSGATLYVEPTEAIELNNKLKQLHLEEFQEIERILAELTALARVSSSEIARNYELFGRIDFLHAKATFARRIEAVKPELINEPKISMQAAFHPLLLLSAKQKSDVVPLSVEIGFNYNIIIITGPNTGGKTVALKTVGLLTMMFQSGMLVPVDSKSQFGIFHKVFADIGDEQSIELSLSTFSSHIAGIKKAIEHCDKQSLLLFDEIGVGTDPKEGAALGEAVIEYLAEADAKAIVTTHYSALKAIAESNKKVENASMEFNRLTLQPTYRFRTGLPGSSYALEVAARLGLPKSVLDRAGQLVGTQERSLADLIARLESELIATEAERLQLKQKLAEATELQSAQKTLADKNRKREKQLLKEGYEEAEKLVDETRHKIDELLKQLQEQQATKSDFKQGKKTIEDLRRELSQGRSSFAPPKNQGPPPEIGDRVWIERLQTDGDLLETFAEGKKAKVRVGKVIYTMDTADLSRHESQQVKYSIPEGVNYQPYKDDISNEISLRGMTIEEARERLDKYFDEIALANLPYVRIVHGKGTGALRRMVRDYLAKNSMVESFQLGEWNEGSWGVTIAKLKSS